jgi:chromosome segregation ATPase
MASSDDVNRLREDVSRLRRNLAQQLTETGDIVSAIKEIDDVLYEGQYFTVADGEEDDFFSDIRRSRNLLGNLGNDLRHYQALMAAVSEDEDVEPRPSSSESGRLPQWERQVAGLDRELKAAQRRLTDVEDPAEAIAAQAEEEKAAYEAKIEALAAELSEKPDLEAKVQALTEELSEKAALESKVLELTSSLEAAAQDQSGAQELNNALEAAKAEADEFRKRALAGAEVLGQLEAEVEEQRETAAVAEQERDDLRKQLDEVQAKLGPEDEAKVLVAEAEAASLSKIEAAEAAKVKAEEEQAAAEQAVQDLKKQLATAEERSVDAETARNRLEASAAESQAKLEAELAQARNEARVGAEEALANMTHLQEKLSASKAALAESEAALSKAGKGSERAATEIESAGSRIAELERERDALQGDVDQARREQALARAGRDEAVRKAVSDSQERSDKRIAELSTQVDELTTKLSQTEDDLRRLRKETTALAESAHEPKDSGQSDLQWRLDNERSRFAESRKSWERRDEDRRKLLEEARTVVIQAQQDQERKDAIAKQLINDLQEQLRQLRS